MIPTQTRLDGLLAAKLTPPDETAFDAFVATARSGHYTQTRAWARVATAAGSFQALHFLARRGERVAGAGVLLRTRLFGLPLAFAQLERGPVAASLEDLPEVLAALRRRCLERGIVRLSVMPYWDGEDRFKAQAILSEAGFADCQRFAGRHARTLRLDLDALDAANPWNSSGLAKVRQNIGRARRAGATARPGRREDVAAFRTMQASLLAGEGRKPPPQAWYDALGEYFLAPGQAMFVGEFQGAPVSVIFITLHNGVATYALGASSGQRMEFAKTVLPMTAAILWAREAGAHTFDMGGIPMPGDDDAKRASIAEFKHSYSRTEAQLVHEHVRWF